MTEVKPVAWVQCKEKIDSLSAPLAQANRSGRYTEPLYDQQAIDALRAEVEGLRRANEVLQMKNKALSIQVEEHRSFWLARAKEAQDGR